MEDVLVRLKGMRNLEKARQGLNPCCCGRCSSTKFRHLPRNFTNVLILVVVEDVLVLVATRAVSQGNLDVLILVVVEDVLVPASKAVVAVMANGS